MTTKEASYVAKKSAQGIRVKLKFKDIDCCNVLLPDLRKEESGLDNGYVGIYTWYNNDLAAMYSMCVKDAKSNCVYRANIKDLELIRNEVTRQNDK